MQCDAATTCSGHGSCTAYGSCECETGYSGPSCKCDNSIECGGHGECVSDTGGCKCNSGYTGDKCEVADCSGHTGCTACASHSGCGWSSATTKCLASNTNGGLIVTPIVGGVNQCATESTCSSIGNDQGKCTSGDYCKCCWVDGPRHTGCTETANGQGSAFGMCNSFNCVQQTAAVGSSAPKSVEASVLATLFTAAIAAGVSLA